MMQTMPFSHINLYYLSIQSVIFHKQIPVVSGRRGVAPSQIVVFAMLQQLRAGEDRYCYTCGFLVLTRLLRLEPVFCIQVYLRGLPDRGVDFYLCEEATPVGPNIRLVFQKITLGRANVRAGQLLHLLVNELTVSPVEPLRGIAGLRG